MVLRCNRSIRLITHRLLGSSFLGLPYRILNIEHKKELLRTLWVPRLNKNTQKARSVIEEHCSEAEFAARGIWNVIRLRNQACSYSVPIGC